MTRVYGRTALGIHPDSVRKGNLHIPKTRSSLHIFRILRQHDLAQEIVIGFFIPFLEFGFGIIEEVRELPKKILASMALELAGFLHFPFFFQESLNDHLKNRSREKRDEPLFRHHPSAANVFFRRNGTITIDSAW